VLILVMVLGTVLTIGVHHRSMMLLPLPYSCITAAIPIGAGLMAARCLRRLYAMVHVIRSPEDQRAGLLSSLRGSVIA